jgi:hypothetical protein
MYGGGSFQAEFIDNTSPEASVINLNSIQIQNVEVYHCQGALGCCIEIDGTWRIAYSGDRAPYDNFVGAVGKEVHLLIHDATYRLDPEEGDMRPVHSHPSDAIQCAELLPAELLVLTHRVKEATGEFVIDLLPENVISGCDFLVFSYENCRDLWRFIHLKMLELADSNPSVRYESWSLDTPEEQGLNE